MSRAFPFMVMLLAGGCAHVEGHVCSARYEYVPTFASGVGLGPRGWFVWARARATDSVHPCVRVYP